MARGLFFFCKHTKTTKNRVTRIEITVGRLRWLVEVGQFFFSIVSTMKNTKNRYRRGCRWHFSFFFAGAESFGHYYYIDINNIYTRIIWTMIKKPGGCWG